MPRKCKQGITCINNSSIFVFLNTNRAYSIGIVFSYGLSWFLSLTSISGVFSLLIHRALLAPDLQVYSSNSSIPYFVTLIP